MSASRRPAVWARWLCAFACAGVAMAAATVALVAPVTASGASIEVHASIDVDAVLELGGLLPLGDSTCALCANFVTSFDRDGAGTGAAFTRMHRNLLVNATYQLDVDGTQPPKLLLVPEPGYELSARVQAISPDRPTITLKKLAAAPATMPLRAEIVTGDVASVSAGKTTFGYDTLRTTAPRSFVAAIDRSDRDGNASTENVFADLTTDGAAVAGLTVVKEGFKGAPDGTRSERDISRLTYRGDASRGTVVPRRASIEVAEAKLSKRTVLTRDERTTLDIELIKPDGGPHTTGTVDELPSRVELTIADEDVNADEALDKRVIYAASALANAELAIAEADKSSRLKVNRLPTNVELTYASLDNDTPSTPDDDSTEVTYRARDAAGNPSRAGRIELRRQDGSRVLTAAVDNAPATARVRYNRRQHGGQALYTSDATADQGTVEVSDRTAAGEKRARSTLVAVPQTMDMTWSATQGTGHVHYVAGARARRAEITLVDERGRKTTIVPDSPPTDMVVDYVKENVEENDETNHVERSKDSFSFRYRANAEVPRATIDITNLKGLAGGDEALPKALNLVLTRIPTSVDFDTVSQQRVKTEKLFDCDSKNPECAEPPEECVDPWDAGSCPLKVSVATTTTKQSDISVATPDIDGKPATGRLGSAELQLTNGPTDRLAPAVGVRPQDGVLIHELGSKYVLSARLSELDLTKVIRNSSVFKKTGGDGLPRPGYSKGSMHLELDSNVQGHVLGFEQKTGSESRTGVIRALLAGVPNHIELDTADGDGAEITDTGAGIDRTSLDWEASAPVSGFCRSSDGPQCDGAETPIHGFWYLVATQKDGGELVPTKQLTLDPMPKRLRVCKTSWGPECAGRTFDHNIERLASGDNDTSDCGRISNCVDGHNVPMPAYTDKANKGSVLITADPATHFRYTDQGGYVDFRDLTRYVLQAHKESVSCGLTDANCPFGYLAMDTGGNPLRGTLVQTGDGKLTRFDFPLVDAPQVPFNAHNHVWSFLQTGRFQGYVASAGTIDCPSGTSITAADKGVTEQFCRGDLLDDDFPVL